MGDVDEVLEELARHVLVGRVLLRELERDGEHVEAVHAHPAGVTRKGPSHDDPGLTFSDGCWRNSLRLIPPHSS